MKANEHEFGTWRLVFGVCRWSLFLSVWCFLASSAAAPRSNSRAEAAAVWPPPPDQPRIRYVKSITSPSDIGGGPGHLKRAMGFLTGEKEDKERFAKPFAVAVDENGNLGLTDTGNNAVYYCDLAHKRWSRWSGAGKQPFASPVGVACRQGILYVADSELGKVFGLAADGRIVLTIASPIQRPVGLAVLRDSLVVADAQAHAIYVFDLEGRLLYQFGKRGLGSGELNFPTHVGTDRNGHILVTDSLNSRVQVFDQSGRFIAQIGSAGDAPGHFGRPKGVAADSFGHIYVVDALFDTVQVFDLEGHLLLAWGQSGTEPGQFGVPSGIAISADNHIYVADGYNHRVQVFEYVGAQ